MYSVLDGVRILTLVVVLMSSIGADHSLMLSWFAWSCDAFDFFSVSLSLPLLSKQFNKPTTSIVRSL